MSARAWRPRRWGRGLTAAALLAVVTMTMSVAQAVEPPAVVTLSTGSIAEFSPNGDAQDETLSVGYCLSGAANVTAVVESVEGAPIRTLLSDRSESAGCGKYVDWDGAVDSGAPAPDGQYRLRLTAENDSGQPTTDQRLVAVNRQVPGRITSPAPAATVAGTATFVLTPTAGFDIEHVQFLMSDSQRWCGTDVSYEPDDDGAYRISWDTAESCGDGARSLTANVGWRDRYGSSHVWTTPVVAVQLANPAAPVVTVQSNGPRVFSPDGDNQTDSVSLSWCAFDDAASGDLRTVVDVRGADGVAVRTLRDVTRAPSVYCQAWWGGLTYEYWDGLDDGGNPVPDGDYTIAVSSTDATGLIGSASLDVAVDRRPPGTITTPADGSSVSGTATFEFTPTPGVTVNFLQFAMAGTGLSCSQQVQGADEDGVWRVEWDTTLDCGDGARTLGATVGWLDRFGEQQWSYPPPRAVRLDNPRAPDVMILSDSWVFSPNGDNQDDSVGLSWCAADDVGAGDLQTVVRVVAAGGDVVRTLREETQLPSAICGRWWSSNYDYWDGRDDEGDPVPDGDYTLEVLATDSSGRTGSSSVAVGVDRRLPGVVSAPADGATVSGTATLEFTPTEGITVDSVYFWVSNQQVSCSSPTATAPDEDGAWRVTLDTAAACGDGERTLNAQVQWRDGFGGQHYWNTPATAVHLDNPAAPEVSLEISEPRVFSPNGDGQEDTASARWCAVDDIYGGDLDTAVRVRDAAGAVVRTLREELRAPSPYCQSWWGGFTDDSWDGLDDDGAPVPDGDYTVEVTSTDASGLSSTKNADLVVDRRLPGALTAPEPGGTVAGTARFVVTPTSGVTIQRVDYSLAGTSFTAHNASRDGTWRTTQAVGSLPGGPATLWWTVQWADRFGATHWYSRSIEVGIDPTAIPLEIDSDVVSGEAPLTAELTVHASDANGAPLRVDVDWNDGTVEQYQLPVPYDPMKLTHEYDEPGSYRAFVSVSNGSGGYAAQSVPIAVSGPANTAPQVTVVTSATSGVAPLDTATTLTASDAEGDDLTYKVDFGDGSPVVTGVLPAAGVEHRYTGVGTYLLRAEISDGLLSVVRYSRIVVGLSQPLRAEAGDALRGVVGTSLRLDGGGSVPAPAITRYSWEFGDGATAEGISPEHAYSEAGTYTATLTVQSGATKATDTTTVVVTDPPAPRGLTVSVTGGGSPLSGAELVVIRPDGTRITGITGGNGAGLIPDLPDGPVTAYVLADGYRPGVAAGTVTDGSGTAAVDLAAGEVGAATLEHHRMTIEEIVDAGIDVTDPENTHVYEAEIHLYFEPIEDEPDPVHVFVTPTGLICASDCFAPVEAPWCAPTDGCYFVPAAGGGGGGGGDGYAYYPQVQYVADEPIIQWLVLPVRASFLKEFFRVDMVVQNLTTGFTFTDGAASLTLPDGLSLAPVASPQSLTMDVPAIPGGESRTVTWTVRGDTEGAYSLSADYLGVVQPLDRPVHLRAIASNPLKVWGASALRTKIIVDNTAVRWAPYRVDVRIENRSPIPIYNLQVEMLDQPADHPDWQADYVFAPALPDEESFRGQLQGTDTIAPCALYETPGAECPAFTAEYIVYPGLGRDADNDGDGDIDVHDNDFRVVTEQSFVRQTGGDVDLAPTIETRCPEPTPSPLPERCVMRFAGPVEVETKDQNGVDVAELTWARSPDALSGSKPVRYHLWTRQQMQTAAGPVEEWQPYRRTIATTGTDTERMSIPATERALGRYYAIATEFSDGHLEYLHSIGEGPARYVSLGDSYSSGEGVPVFEPGTDADLTADPSDRNTCHRSAQGAYGRLLVAGPPQGVNMSPAEFAACSGAIASDIVRANDIGLPAQASRVNQFTDLITLTMGGNDIGFRDIAIACVAIDCSWLLDVNEAIGSDEWLNAAAQMWQTGGWLYSRIKTVAEGVEACLNPVDLPAKIMCAYKANKAIKAADELRSFHPDKLTSPRHLHDHVLQDRLTRGYLALAERAPSAKITVLPYPPILGADDEAFAAHCTLATAGPLEFGLSTNERQALRRVLGTLNAAVSEAVDDANDSLRDEGRHPAVELASLDGAYRADEALCGRTGLNGDTHYNALVDPVGITPNHGPVMYSLHPNAEGQQDYAEALANSLAPGSGPAQVLLHPETLTQAGRVVIQGSSPVLQGSARVLQASGQSLQGSATLVAQLSWPGSTASLRLIAPDGRVLDEHSAGVTATTTATSQTLTVPEAQPGEWQIRVYGDDVDPRGELATVSAYALTDTPAPPDVTVSGDRSDPEAPTFLLSAASTAPSGSVYTWYFSDSTTATGPSVSHTFGPGATTWWANVAVTTPDGFTGWGSVALGGPPRAPVLTAPTLDPATIGSYWSVPLSATGNPAPRFSVTAGELPPGITVDPVTGLLAGTPTAGGSWTFAVTATNEVGSASTEPLTLVVQQAPAFTAETPPTDAVAGQAVSYAFTASGAPAPTFTATGQLPPGVTLSSAGLLSGTPTAAGTFTFGVTVTNAVGTDTSGPFTVTVAPNSPAAPDGVTATAGDGRADVVWQAPVTTGGSSITEYRVAASPGGRTCSVTGTLSCTVTGLTNGQEYTFTVTATNAGGETSEASQPSAAVTPLGPPDAPLDVTVSAADGSASLNWTPPAETGGSEIAGYVVTAEPGGARCETTSTSCTVRGLANGTEYSFVVLARTAGGDRGSAPVTATPVGPPSEPTDVAAQPGDGSASISWTASATPNGAAITGYTVTASPGGATCTGPSTSCTVTGLTNGTAYTFAVTAANAAGLRSVASLPSPSVVPVGAPGAPADVAVTAGDAAIDVTWTAPEETGGSPITQYVATANPGGASCTASEDTACRIPDLPNGTAYTVTVSATNAAGLVGTSAATAPVTPLGPPATPVGVHGSPGDGAALVTWQSGSQPGAAPATGYVVTASPGSATCATTSTSCEVLGLTNGTAYRFTVVAQDASGRSSAASDAATVTPVGAPSPPRSVVAVAGDRTIRVTWQAPTAPGGAPLNGYAVDAVPAPGSPTDAPRGSCTATATTCTITGLRNGVAYTVTVVARNSAGLTSQAAAATRTVVPFGPPTSPTGVQVTSARRGVTVSWAPSNGNGSPVTSYTASLSPGGAQCTARSGTSCVITGLNNGRNYTVTVTVTARNAAGLVSPRSSPLVFNVRNSGTVVPVRPPTSPTRVQVTAGRRGVTVSWAPSNGNGSPVTSYTASLSPGGAQCTARSGTRCLITGLNNGRNYTVTVTARNAAGLVSPPSSPVVFTYRRN
jgi:flagellar hook assembly protein FlgD/PKD repeat protein/lysophospholipase L1-like esterase